MIMAAGQATRLKPFSDLIPKPLVPMLGVPILRLNVDDLEAAGIRRAVINIHHLPGQMQKAVRAMQGERMEIVASDETSLLLGSAGGLAKALPHFGGEPFLYFNAGDLRTLNISALIQRHYDLREKLGVRLTFAVLKKGRFGEVQNEIQTDTHQELITGLGGPKPGAPFFVGVAVIESECLAGISPNEPSQFVPKILEPAIREKKAGVYHFDGEFFDCGEPKPWWQAHFRMMELLEQGRCPALWKARFLAESERVGPGVWRQRGVSAVGPAPSYLGMEPPAGISIGSHSVLYGPGPGQGSRLEKGLAFQDLWFQG